MVAVRAIAERSKPYGRLLRPNGGVDGATVSSIFDQFDEDGDGQVLLLSDLMRSRSYHACMHRSMVHFMLLLASLRLSCLLLTSADIALTLSDYEPLVPGIVGV